MRHTTISGELERTLGEYAHAAARLLQADVAAGAEVELELGARRGRAHTPLYTCRPLTGRFIAEREPQLARLPEYEAALQALRGFDGLERYLVGRPSEARQAVEARQAMRTRDLRAEDAEHGGARAGKRLSSPDDGSSVASRSHARQALSALLEDVFAEQTDFELHPERLAAALARLERAELASAPGSLTLVALLRGMAISSPELRMTRGLTIATPATLRWAPAQALAVGDEHEHEHEREREHEHEHLLVALTCEESVDGRAVLRDLLRALRLFGDGRVTLGPLAWARVDGQDTWTAVALGMGGRPHGMLVVAPEQEDELRAFCNLVSRRTPDSGELAWALRRYELGCERVDPYEGLSDHLLALRALLEPEGPASGLLAHRVAALCATPERRPRLIERMARAQRLERAVIAGAASPSAAGMAVAGEVSAHLRALLRDVICGHLPSDLTRLADELLAAGSAEALAAADAEAVAVVEAQTVEREGEGEEEEQLADREQQLTDGTSDHLGGGTPAGNDSRGAESAPAQQVLVEV